MFLAPSSSWRDSRVRLIGWSARVARGEAAGASWVFVARDLLRDRFSLSLTRSDIAAAVGVHPVQLARQFRRTFRCSAGEYVRRVRIDVACELLRTSKPLSDIALGAGFSDQSHFSRVFTAQPASRLESTGRASARLYGRIGLRLIFSSTLPPSA